MVLGTSQTCCYWIAKQRTETIFFGRCHRLQTDFRGGQNRGWSKLQSRKIMAFFNPLVDELPKIALIRFHIGLARHTASCRFKLQSHATKSKTQSFEGLLGWPWPKNKCCGQILSGLSHEACKWRRRFAVTVVPTGLGRNPAQAPQTSIQTLCWVRLGLAWELSTVMLAHELLLN